MKKLGAELNGYAVVLRVNPDIARALKEEESAVLKDLRVLGKDVTIPPTPTCITSSSNLMAVRAGARVPRCLCRGQV